MGDTLLIFVLFNCALVSVLLWLITFFGSFLYETKHDLNREVHFECGFFSINKSVPSYSLNFVISAIFLILYDVEFLILIPAFFNLQFLPQPNVLLLITFIVVMVFSLLLDVESNSLKWCYN